MGWIKSLVSLTKRFKRSNLAQKILNYKHGLKIAIMAIFQKGLEWPCPVSTLKCGPQKRIIALEKLFLF